MRWIKMKNMIIQPVNKNEKNWNILFEQIVKGNVIPVIGPEMVRIGNKSSLQFLIDAFAGPCGIDEGEMVTFSQLVFDKRYKSKDMGDIHDLLTLNLNSPGNADYFNNDADNSLLVKFLRIPYFPFVITTTFDPIVENMMRRIHGEKLRVLSFRNDAGKNDDITNGEETKIPTVYYMFGKADGKSGSFVVTDTDLLKFSQSWMLPNDISSNAKPSVLSSVLAKRYLLVVGYNYQDWLFRFFWYAMKNDSFGSERGGMLAHSRHDQELIAFLTRANAFSQVEPDMAKFVEKIYKGIGEVEKIHKNAKHQFETVPEEGTDVFLSYSRGDSNLVEDLYEILTRKGLHVWYDRKNTHKGMDFMRQIENAVKHSTFFVPVLTSTIIQQAEDEHPYRDEWRYAVEHIHRIGGIPYCFPFYEENFDMDDIKAAIPNDLKRHDAYCFTMLNYKKKAEEMADYLLAEKERRRHNG
jgi:hypothetical protein